MAYTEEPKNLKTFSFSCGIPARALLSCDRNRTAHMLVPRENYGAGGLKPVCRLAILAGGFYGK